MLSIRLVEPRHFLSRGGRPSLPLAQMVNSPGEKLLSRSRFAQYQNRGGSRGNLLDFVQHLTELGAGPDDFLEAVVELDLLLEVSVLLDQAVLQRFELRHGVL